MVLFELCCIMVNVVAVYLHKNGSFVTQYNKRYILSTLDKIEMFALSNRIFNKLSNYTKFINIEVIRLKIQVLQSVNFLLFSLYLTHSFAHYLRINLADFMSLLLCWVTYVVWSSKISLKSVIFNFQFLIGL